MIGTGNQIRTMFVSEGARSSLDSNVNDVLMFQLHDHEIIDIKPITQADEGAWLAVLIIYKVIGI